MPIKINLLAEAQHAEDLRRRDPVKRGIWIAGFLVAVVVIYIGNLQWLVWQKQNEYKQFEDRWKKLEPDFNKVTENKKEVEAIQDKLSLLDQLHTNRFLWGNAFNALQHTVVPDIQVTHMHSEQKFDHVDGTTSGKVHTPGAAVEKITLNIEAKDLNPMVEGQQNFAKFKDALSSYGYFQQKLGKDGFMIDGNISPPLLDPTDPSKQFKTFSLVAHFPEVRHDD